MNSLKTWRIFKLENVHKDLKAGCSIEKSMPGESHNQSQSRLRAQKNKLCDLIKEHEEEKQGEKRQKALDHQQALAEVTHIAEGSVEMLTGDVEDEAQYHDAMKKHKAHGKVLQQKLKQIKKAQQAPSVAPKKKAKKGSKIAEASQEASQPENAAQKAYDAAYKAALQSAPLGMSIFPAEKKAEAAGLAAQNAVEESAKSAQSAQSKDDAKK